MNNKKKKILLISDDIRVPSGVGTMAKELVLGVVHKYDIVNVAGAVQHQNAGQIINMDAATAQITGIKDAHVTLYCVNNYGDETIIFEVLRRENPDAIMLFTDPRFFVWFFVLEKQIRNKIPVVYLNIWDHAVPYPMYNRPYYLSTDVLFSISKQTYNINKWVLRAENCLTLNGYYNEKGELIPYEITNI